MEERQHDRAHTLLYKGKTKEGEGRWWVHLCKSRSIIWCHNLFSFLKNHVDFAGQFMGHAGQFMGHAGQFMGLMFLVPVDSLQMVGGENDCKLHRTKDNCRTQRNSCHLLSARHIIGQFMSRMFFVPVDSLQMVGGENDCKLHRTKDNCRTRRNSCHLLSARHLIVYYLERV